jgi:hypothetical protein
MDLYVPGVWSGGRGFRASVIEQRKTASDGDFGWITVQKQRLLLPSVKPVRSLVLVV